MYTIFVCVRFCKEFYHNSERDSIENSRKSFQFQQLVIDEAEKNL